MAKKEESKKEIKKEKKEKKEDKEIKRENKEELLVSLEEYVKPSGIHLGTKVITSYMRKYVYKRRADGLATINTNEINRKINIVVNFLSQYEPQEIIVACKREAGWVALKKFNELTGIRVYTKKYPTGIITNTQLPGFFEPKVMFIIDPWIDKNPLNDAVKTNLPIISLCDTNNLTSYIDLVIPCNNKSNKSLGLIFWILTREYCKRKKIKIEMPKIEEFTGE